MKQFILRAPEHAQALIAFLKANAGPQAASGRPLSVEVAEYDSKRSHDQNRLLWAVLTEISEQVEVDGKRFSKEAWYAHYLDLFAPKQEGPKGLVPVGSSQMKRLECAEFTTKIQANAAQEFGVEFVVA